MNVLTCSVWVYSVGGKCDPQNRTAIYKFFFTSMCTSLVIRIIIFLVLIYLNCNYHLSRSSVVLIKQGRDRFKIAACTVHKVTEEVHYNHSGKRQNTSGLLWKLLQSSAYILQNQENWTKEKVLAKLHFKYKDKVGMKHTRGLHICIPTVWNNGGRKREEDYFIHVPLVLLFCLCCVVGWSNCVFHPCLFSVIFTGPSLLEMLFFRIFLLVFVGFGGCYEWSSK